MEDEFTDEIFVANFRFVAHTGFLIENTVRKQSW